ncbi:mitotic spindle assembly checkpoint protein MAD2B-like [Clavelina lepadiformis]|uniref:mitotic spindle assembly checkpoint protein MAD2B-like n=1 Tax=Clavelina lepadiformis TaxID=159417 RepID=UPI004041FE89
MDVDIDEDDDEEFFPLNQEQAALKPAPSLARVSPIDFPPSSPIVSSPPTPPLKLVTNEDNTLTEASLKDLSSHVTCDFLEVAIHQILYYRKLYPRGVFSKRKKYEVPVFIAWHPGLRDYIKNVVKSLKPLVAENVIRRVVLNILTDDTPVEKFVFELNNVTASGNVSEDEYMINIEVSLRDALLRISSYDGKFEYDSKSSRFEVVVHVQGGSALDLIYESNPKLKWVQEDVDEPKNEKLVPLKSLTDSPFMKMQLFVLQAPNCS